MKLPLLAAGALLFGTSAIAWVPLSDQQVSSATEATQPLPPPTTTDAAAPATQVPSDEAVPPTVTAATAPAETVSIAQLDTSPRPATTNYPPCHPGAGDDNCIQLYERGVRTALNDWSQSTGGLASRSAAPVQTAMADTGGAMAGDGRRAPFETASSERGAVQTAMTDTSESSEVLAAPDATAPVTTADASSAMAAAAASGTDLSQYQGMGGPEENVQTGYPPCSRTVTDRCIQLYERGVTGRGN
jgi:hypothetical protein